MRLLAAEPRSIARHSFPCQCLCGTILVTTCSMVWDWRVSRAGTMPFYWRSCSLTFCLVLFSISLHSFYGLINWCCGIGVFRLLGCSSLSPSLALPTFFNNNNNISHFVAFIMKMSMQNCGFELNGINNVMNKFL